MLMIAISIVSHRMFNSFAEPKLRSLLSKLRSLLSHKCKFERGFNLSFLTETQGTNHLRCKITEYQGVCRAKQQIFSHCPCRYLLLNSRLTRAFGEPTIYRETVWGR